MTEPGSTEPDTAEPTLRKDAALNRERLIEAGRDLFAKRGLSATLNDVARHAGLGVGTAYRRFANKDELIDAILERQNQEMEGVLRSALAEPDPWDGLVLFLERSTAMQARDRGMAQIFTGRHSCNVSYDETRDRFGILVEDDAFVSVPHQPAHEVGAHPSQADHAELHSSLPFVSSCRAHDKLAGNEDHRRRDGCLGIGQNHGRYNPGREAGVAVRRGR